MNNNKDFYLTKEGLESLKKELDELLNKKRPQLVKRVAEARNKGDLSENTEYTAAREDLSMLDGKIEELETIVSRAKLIEKNENGACEKVSLGCKVTVKVDKQTREFHVVGEWEADPANKKISHSSPLGQALLGKKKGEEVEVEAPAGKIVYTIKKIY